MLSEHRADGHGPREQEPNGFHARVILATAPGGCSKLALVDRLDQGSKVMEAEQAPGPIKITPIQIIRTGRSIREWPSGTAADSDGTLRFAVLIGVRPMVEKFPPEHAHDACQRMITRKTAMRAVFVLQS